MHQQIDYGKINIIAKDSLLHTLLEKTDSFCRIMFLVAFEKFIDFRIFFQVLKETLMSIA